MQQFTVNPNKFKEIKKQMLIRSIPMLLLVSIAAIAINYSNTTSKETDFTWLFIAVPFFVLILAWGIRKGLKRQKSLMDSYILTVSNNSITREQANTPTISIYYSDITSIAKYKNGTFIIRSKDPADEIIVPAQIDNYEEFESLIASVNKVNTENSQPQLQKYTTLLSLINLACMICVYVASNKFLVGATGTVCTALTGWSFYKAWMSKNLDSKTKKSLLWGLLALLSVVAITIMKLTGIYTNS
ncbi:hypothetical protein QTN47_05290 [Danxiaibacter flavus]|uniref:YcxB-like protein domain-containing protein n=1 Tax=Danxiaibacter flavus TaxID=3049108 RepID=A0ABV3ZCT9_9BACT|nr:hypothetical protein QNM32_05290 [Chitinophagaceae bacterium DXS]